MSGELEHSAITRRPRFSSIPDLGARPPSQALSPSSRKVRPNERYPSTPRASLRGSLHLLWWNGCIVSRLRCMNFGLRKFDLPPIAWRPRLSRFQCGALCFADRHHLSRVRFGQLAPADEPTPFADLGQIFAHIFLRFCHSQFQTCIISCL